MVEIGYEVKGLDEALIRVRGVDSSVKRQIRELIEEAAEAALGEMLARVPRSGKSDSIADSIDKSGVVFHPGGLGGGGYWEVRVGPGADAPEHLEYVLEGTGVHGRFHSVIYPDLKKAMAFEGNLGHIARRSVLGQEAQTAWLVESQEAARETVSLGIHRIRVEG